MAKVKRVSQQALRLLKRMFDYFTRGRPANPDRHSLTVLDQMFAYYRR